LQIPGTGDELTWVRSTRSQEVVQNHIRSCVVKIYVNFTLINIRKSISLWFQLLSRSFFMDEVLFHSSFPTPLFLVEEKHRNHYTAGQDPHFSAQC
jgi:hypothetical protein